MLYEAPPNVNCEWITLLPFTFYTCAALLQCELHVHCLQPLIFCFPCTQPSLTVHVLYAYKRFRSFFIRKKCLYLDQMTRSSFNNFMYEKLKFAMRNSDRETSRMSRQSNGFSHDHALFSLTFAILFRELLTAMSNIIRFIA